MLSKDYVRKSGCWKWKYALTLGARGLEVSDFEVSYECRTIRTATCPIGIEPEEFHAKLKEPKVQDRAKLLNEKYKDVKLMVSVDRLDYIKGIPLRLDAMETFLTKHPEYVGRVVLLQVLIPSREDVEGYQRLHDDINERVSGINSKFGSSLRSLHCLSCLSRYI
jgi:trehalose 6-phosphate synthase